MKRYSQRSGHTAMAELNVTPLLDLAFVLLIIFIITTPLLENHLAIDLSTGPRLNSQPLDPKSIRTVSIGACSSPQTFAVSRFQPARALAVAAKRSGSSSRYLSSRRISTPFQKRRSAPAAPVQIETSRDVAPCTRASRPATAWSC